MLSLLTSEKPRQNSEERSPGFIEPASDGETDVIFIPLGLAVAQEEELSESWCSITISPDFTHTPVSVCVYVIEQSLQGK